MKLKINRKFIAFESEGSAICKPFVLALVYAPKGSIVAVASVGAKEEHSNVMLSLHYGKPEAGKCDIRGLWLNVNPLGPWRRDKPGYVHRKLISFA